MPSRPVLFIALDIAGGQVEAVRTINNPRSEVRVDEIMAEAETAGATILKLAATLQWGGYGGSFKDPDGYIGRLQRPGKD